MGYLKTRGWEGGPSEPPLDLPLNCHDMTEECWKNILTPKLQCIVINLAGYLLSKEISYVLNSYNPFLKL